MASSALEKIQAIQDKASKEIEALKSEAISDVVRKLSEAKSVVSDLERQYEELTGKTVKGEKAGVTRKRLSKEQKEALVITVGEIIKGAINGTSMGEIVKQAGESASAVRQAVSEVKGLKKTGAKASTLYFVK
jgi:flagellar biosynthesis chaperone FliJ